QDAGVALPHEHPLDVLALVAAEELLELLGVEGEQHDGHVQAFLPHPPRQLEHVHVPDVEGRDHEVEALLPPQEEERLLAARHPGDARDVVEVEVAELAEQALAELARLLQQEGVVRAGDEQDVHDAVAHQVVEVVEAAGTAGKRLLDVHAAHGMLAGAAAARAHSTAPLRRLGARRRSLTSHGPPDRLVALSPELSGPLPGRAEQRGRAMGSHERMWSRRPVLAAPWMLLALAAAGAAAEGGRIARAAPADATSPPGAWLDAQATKNWNSRTAELPKAAARETDSLLPAGPSAEELLQPPGP